ncbi:MAG: hypothetical protein ACWA5X_10465 [bacterium]
MHTHFSIRRFIKMALPAVVFLTACSEQSGSSGSPTVAITVPDRVHLRALNQQGIQVRVTASLGNSGGQQYVDVEDGLAVISLEGLPVGEETITLSLVAMNTSAGELPLATASRTIQLVAGGNTLSFSNSDYQYDDADNDRYSNADELAFDTDPLNESSQPLPPGRVFLTSEKGTGDLSTWASAGGLTGTAAADQICQTLANNNGLGNAYKAWISSEKDDAYCRVLGLSGKKILNCGQASLPISAGPWVRLDGQLFARSLSDLVEGKVLTNVRYDELAFDHQLNGESPAQGTQYWTGSDSQGLLKVERNSSGHCDNWGSQDQINAGYFGIATGATNAWTDWDNLLCDAQAHLLCMEVRTTAAPLQVAVQGKQVFTTREKISANFSSATSAGGASGLEAADNVCKASAEAAGLANASAFQALVSDSSISATERIRGSGPWVRIDGFPIAQTKETLFQGPWAVPMNMDEFRQPVSGRAWTGTNPDGSSAERNCENWSNPESEQQAASSYAELNSRYGVYPYNGLCSGLAHLVCVEDEE